MRSLPSFLLSLIIFASHASSVAGFTQTASTSSTTTAHVEATTPTSADQTAPTTPILVAPSDGSYTGDNKPEFTWRRSTDPNSNYLYYTLELNGVATYLGISNLGNSASANYSARVDHDEIKLIPVVHLLDGNYNWRLIASDGSGNQSRSTTWNLIIDTLPPLLQLIKIDQIPYPPSTTTYSTTGPTDLSFTFQTESWVTLSMQVYDSQNQLVQESLWRSQASSTLEPSASFDPGRYRLVFSAYDLAGNTFVYPDLELIIEQATLTIPLPNIPGITHSPSYVIPYTPLTFSALTSTIASIESRYQISIILSVLIALVILSLLIYIWRQRYNLILLDQAGHPLSRATIHHSNPSYTHSLATTNYLTSQNHGKIYLPHLSIYSTLSIQTDDQLYLLSLSRKLSKYQLVLQ